MGVVGGFWVENIPLFCVVALPQEYIRHRAQSTSYGFAILIALTFLPAMLFDYREDGAFTPGMLLEESLSEDFIHCAARCSSGWQAALLKISGELKQKLQDADFVARCCDVDGSGDLDVQELQRAAKVFGFRFEQDKLRRLMDGPRISIKRFSAMVDKLRRSDRPQTRRAFDFLRPMR